MKNENMFRRPRNKKLIFQVGGEPKSQKSRSCTVYGAVPSLIKASPEPFKIRKGGTMRAKEKRIAAKRLPILLWKTSDSSWIDVAKVAEKIREHKKLTSAEREVKHDFWKPILAALKEEHQKRKK